MKKEFKAIRDIKFPKFGIDVKAGEYFKLDDKQFAEVSHFGYGKWFDFANKPAEAELTPELKEIEKEVSEGMISSAKKDEKIIEEIKTEDFKEKELKEDKPKLKAQNKKKSKK